MRNIVSPCPKITTTLDEKDGYSPGLPNAPAPAESPVNRLTPVLVAFSR